MNGRAFVQLCKERKFSMIKVTLANGETKEFDSQLSAFDAARELGEAKTACAADIAAQAAV